MNPPTRKRVQSDKSLLKVTQYGEKTSFWGELPMDILEKIAERLTLHSDLYTFRFVCKHWQSVALENHTRLPYSLPMNFCLPRRNPPPLLLFSSKGCSQYNTFYSIYEQNPIPRVDLPETHGKCLYSTKGWLLMNDFVLFPEELELFNPLTRDRIILPPLSSMPIAPGIFDRRGPAPNFIQKAVLSSDPLLNPGDWILMVIVGEFGRLCYTRAGEEWALIGDIHNGCARPEECLLMDIVHHRGNLYAATESGMVSVCDINSIQPNFRPISDPIMEENCSLFKKYLVMTPENLLLLVVDGKPLIMNEDYEGMARIFDVFVLDYSCEWFQSETIGDNCLFLGKNESIALSTVVFPKLQKGCIYFTCDDSYYSSVGNDLFTDNGMFELKAKGDTLNDDQHDLDGNTENYRASYDGVQRFFAVKSSYRVPHIWFIPSSW